MDTAVATSEIVTPATGPEDEVRNYEGALGWRNLEDGRVIVLYPMIYTWRLCVGQQMDGGYDRGWCYPKGSLAPALIALAHWDGNDDPVDGWIKEVGVGRRRPDGDPAREYIEA